MIEKTKITLSDKERELVCNTSWILTKLAIIEKVYQLFGEVVASIEQLANSEKSLLPGVFFINSPKISRGENYQQLPYVMLDYPRYFDKENTLAIRTFFWWGNFFSTSLQLSGASKTAALPALVHHFSFLQQAGYWVCINETPWHHHFENDNYVKLEHIGEETFKAILNNAGFIKIAKKIPLQQWDDAKAFIENTFGEMIRLLTTH